MVAGKTVHLWNIATGQEDRRFSLLTGDRGTATLRDAATGRELRRFVHGATVFSLAFSPDGQFVLTGGENRLACLWDTATGQQSRCFAGHTGNVTAVAFSPEGRFVWTGDWDYTENLWEVATGRAVWSVERPPRYKGQISFIESVAFSPDGRFVVMGYSDTTARLRDVATGKEVHRFEHEGRVRSVGFSPDSRFIFTGSEDNLTRFWNPTTGQELCRLISFSDGTWVVVDPEGRFDTNNLDNNPGLHWIMPDDPLTPLPLEIFMRDYYEPRLLPRILAGERFRPVRSLADLNRVQPKVQISKIEPHPTVPDAVSVTVEVAKAARKFQRGDKKVLVETGVYDLRLFRDGQLVGYAPAADGEIPVDPQTGTAVQAFTVTLPRTGDTQEVTFSAYAFNLDRVKSTTYRKIFAMPARLSPVKGRAYLISAGVNAYENSAWDLHFAANDARRLQPSLVEHLSRSAAYDDIVPITLISDSEMRDGTRVVTENRATKQNVQTVFARLAGKEIEPERAQDIPNLQKLQPVRPEDLVLISFSSHGYTDDSGNFYFLFSDIGEGSGRQIGRRNSF